MSAKLKPYFFRAHRTSNVRQRFRSRRISAGHPTPQWRRTKLLRKSFRDVIRLFSDGLPSHFRAFPAFRPKRVQTVSDQSIMNAANPSEETKARFAEPARMYQPKLP